MHSAFILYREVFEWIGGKEKRQPRYNDLNLFELLYLYIDDL